MTELRFDPKAKSADFAVDAGCPSCGGKIQVRVTQGTGAWSYCPACHWLSRPQVVMNGNSLQLTQPPTAEA